MRYLPYLCFGMCLLLASAAATAKPAAKPLGTFGNWTAYAVTEDKQPVCYMALTANLAHGKSAKDKSGRNNAHLIITHRPREGSSDTVSYEAGYVYKSASDVKLHIGNATFSLFTDKDTAWARDPLTDHQLAAAIRKAAGLTITGIPAKNPAGRITDKISLAGADQAYAAIGKACGLIKEPPKTKTAPAKSTATRAAKTPPAKSTHKTGYPN